MRKAFVVSFILLLTSTVLLASAQSGDTPTTTPVGCWFPNHTWVNWEDCVATMFPATSTDTPVPTPTQEITPVPTVIPPPITCDLRSKYSTIRVREEPDGAILGTLVQGHPYTSPQFIKKGDYLWMKHGGDVDTPAGWSAVYSYSANVWWVWGTNNSDKCVNVLGWDPTLTPPPAFAFSPMGYGMHNTPVETDPAGMMRGLAMLINKGIRPVLVGVETNTGLVWVSDHGGISVYRQKANDVDNNDCPDINRDPYTASKVIISRTRAKFWIYTPPDSGIFISVDNECKGFWTDLNWTDIYLSETIKAFGDQGFRMVIMNTFAGDWTQERVVGLPLTWEACIEYNCVLGLHAYGALPGVWVSYAIDAVEPWLRIYGGQHKDIRQWLVEQHPNNISIPLLYTEVGTSTGGEPFQVADCIQWFEKVRYSDVGVIGMACWTSGKGGYPESADGQVENAIDLIH